MLNYEDAVKALKGDSCGGQLIVHHEGVNVLVGKHVQGALVVEDSDVARAIVAKIQKKAPSAGEAAETEGRRGRRGPKAAAPEPAADAGDEPEPVHHEVIVSDETITLDNLGDEPRD